MQHQGALITLSLAVILPYASPIYNKGQLMIDGCTYGNTSGPVAVIYHDTKVCLCPADQLDGVRKLKLSA